MKRNTHLSLIIWTTPVTFGAIMLIIGLPIGVTVPRMIAYGTFLSFCAATWSLIFWSICTWGAVCGTKLILENGKYCGLTRGFVFLPSTPSQYFYNCSSCSDTSQIWECQHPTQLIPEENPFFKVFWPNWFVLWRNCFGFFKIKWNVK